MNFLKLILVSFTILFSPDSGTLPVAGNEDTVQWEDATRKHLGWFLELSLRGSKVQELYSNRNFLDAATAYEKMSGVKSAWASVQSVEEIPSKVEEFGTKAISEMWLELAALVYDPCIWKLIETQDLKISEHGMAAKPEDLSLYVPLDCRVINPNTEPGKTGENVGSLKLENSGSLPSFPRAAPDELVKYDKPTNDEGEKMYSDHSKFATKKEENFEDLVDYETDYGDSSTLGSFNIGASLFGPYNPDEDRVNPKDLTINVISNSPRVYVIPNFATDEETDEMIALANAWDGDSKHDITGFSYEQPTTEELPYRLSERMHSLLNLENDMGHTLRMRHYEGGRDEYHPLHTDWFEIERGDGEKSNLIVTAMLCLSTPEKGGATYFPQAKPKAFRIKPRKGTLITWYSCSEDGKEDLNSEHMGETLIKGHKWTATNFIYQHNSKCGKRNMLGKVKHRGKK
eukprot:g1001.t1